MSKSAMVTVPSAVTVAAGAFAPGHLGELTLWVPETLSQPLAWCLQLDLERPSFGIRLRGTRSFRHFQYLCNYDSLI